MLILKGELRAKFHPNFFFIYRFVYAYYNVMQNIIIFGKGLKNHLLPLSELF